MLGAIGHYERIERWQRMRPVRRSARAVAIRATGMRYDRHRTVRVVRVRCEDGARLEQDQHHE